jgi:hypothetical protein
MKNIEEQLNNLQKTVMNTEEKGAVRGAVVSYMQENPLIVRNQEDSRLQYRTSNFNNRLITKTRMTIAIIIALLLGGGTSFAAEGALPGDVLYPIKVYVNENAQELAAVSDKAEAKVQAKLAERRLEEAEKLAVEGRLNAETSADLKLRFEEHAEKSKEHRSKVEDGDDAEEAAEINSDIEVSLKMHQKLLEDIGGGDQRTEDLVKGILEVVRHHLKETGEKRASMEERAFTGEGPDAKTAVEGAMTAAQNKIDEVVKFLEAKKATLSVHVMEGAQAHLKEANAAMAEGKAKMAVPAYKDAFALFKKAAREAQEAKIFAATAGELKVERKDSGEVRIEAEGERKSEKIEDRNDEASDKNEDYTGTEVKTEANGEVEVDDDGVSVDGDTKIRIGL